MTAHQLKAVMPVAAPDIVTMSGVRFAWPSRDSFRMAIDDFTLADGERLLLIGPSGSGKSTFLSLLAGIVTPQAGSIDRSRHGHRRRCAARRATASGLSISASSSRCSICCPMARCSTMCCCRSAFPPNAASARPRERSAEAEAARLLGKLGHRSQPLDAGRIRRQPQRRPAAARRGGAGADRLRRASSSPTSRPRRSTATGRTPSSTCCSRWWRKPARR